MKKKKYFDEIEIGVEPFCVWRMEWNGMLLIKDIFHWNYDKSLEQYKEFEIVFFPLISMEMMKIYRNMLVLFNTHLFSFTFECLLHPTWSRHIRCKFSIKKKKYVLNRLKSLAQTRVETKYRFEVRCAENDLRCVHFHRLTQSICIWQRTFIDYSPKISETVRRCLVYKTMSIFLSSL